MKRSCRAKATKLMEDYESTYNSVEGLFIMWEENAK